jgi:H+/gluconate symporter-like permease
MEIESTTVISSLVAFLVGTLTVGYGRALGTKNSAVLHLVVGMMLVFTAYIMRSVYWDILPDAASWTVKAVVGRDVNIFFDAIVIWGALHGHLAVYLMIPSSERKYWSVLTAWLYPPLNKTRLWAWLCEVFRKQ